MEFLFITGIAILSIGSVAGLFVSFGILDIGNFLPESCILMAGLSCDDFVVNEDSIKIVVRNGLNKNIELKLFIDVCEVSSKKITVEYGEVETFALSGCSNNQSAFREDLKFEYSFSSGSILHKEVGRLTARKQECIGLFDASCGGLIQDGATLFLCNFDTPDFVCEVGGDPNSNVGATFVEGKYGEGGVYIEKGINLIPNSGLEEGLGNFFLVGQSETLPVIDIFESYEGQSVHFESTDNLLEGSTVVTDMNSTFSVTPGEDLTLTHYVRKDNVIAGLPEIDTAYNLNQWLSDGSTVCTTCEQHPVVSFGPGSENWTRYETTFTVPGGASHFWYTWAGIGYTGGGDLWMDNVQLERRSSSTPYAADGPDELTFDKTSSNANALNGTLEFWVKPFWDSNDGIRYEFLTIVLSDGTIRFFKDVDNTIKFLIEETISGDEYIVEADVSSWNKGDWTHLATTWISDVGNGENLMNLFVDGTLVDGQASRLEAIGIEMKAPAFLYVGTDENFQNHAYAVIDDFRASNVLRQ